ncbi:MAG: stage III sporulation protein AE [Firmicutes bacterium]|nr:stage III sporulation protein AE [Bacillota bacterium]
MFAEEYTIDGADVYNEKTREIIDGRLSLNPVDIINKTLKSVYYEVAQSKSMLKSMLMLAVLSGMLRVLSDSFGKSGTNNVAFFACFGIMTLSALNIFMLVVGYGVEVVHTICDFITKFEPIFVGLLASAGAVTQAAAFQPVMSVCVYVITLVVDRIILPLSYFSAVLGIVNNIGARVEIGTLNRLLQSFAKWVLTGVLTLFTSVMALYGFGSGAFNTVATKTAKFAVGSLVPVVGGILSETIETVLSGTNLLKNAVGTAGMIAVISLAAVPIIKIWIMMMILKITAAVIEPFSDERITGVLLDIAGAVTTVFSMVIAVSVLFVVSIGIIIASTGVKL